MKLRYAILFLLSLLSTRSNSQTICDSLGFNGQHMFVVMVDNDYYSPTIYYSGNNFLSYPVISVELFDTSEVVLRDSLQLFGIMPQDSAPMMVSRVTHKTNKPYIYVDGYLWIRRHSGMDSFDCKFYASFMFSQNTAAICDSLALVENTLTLQDKDSITIEMAYWGSTGIAYPSYIIEFDDTTDLVVRYPFVDGFLMDTNRVSFEITSKTGHTPDSLTGHVIIYKTGELYCTKPFTVYFDIPSGLAKTTTEAEFKVYPNPVTGEVLNIQSANAGRVSITDLTGRVIIRERITPGNNILDTGKLNPGQYILHFERQNGYTKALKISIPR